MKRIALFVATNLAVMATLMIVVRLTGLDGWITAHGLALGPLLGFAAVFGFGGAFISLALSRWMALRSTGATVITTPRTREEQWLMETVARHARATGLPMPAVAIYPSESPNAFATGASRKRALVAVSTGLLEAMTPEEADAVVAHEVAHIANGDMVTLALLQGVLNTFVIFLARIVGYIVDRGVFRTQEGVGPAFFVVSLVAEIALGLMASLIVLAVSRRREYRADAGAAALVGPRPMIAALRRLDRPADPLPAALRAFAIRGQDAGWTRWLRTHPTIAQRIAALEAASRGA